MAGGIRAYKVTKLDQVNKTKYKEGDVFIDDKDVGMLVNGDIVKMIPKVPSLAGYAKKTEVQQMIDDAIAGLGGES